jgi:hypothetical protein
MAATNVGQSFRTRTLTAWKQTQAQQATRRALTQRFLDNAAIAADSFTRAQANQIN